MTKISTAHLKGQDHAYVLGWLVGCIELKGVATREDAVKAIASARRRVSA